MTTLNGTSLERALFLPGCDAEREEGWYTLGALDDVLWALPEFVIEDAPGGLDQLQAARRRWIRRNSVVGDAFAEGVGLL